MKYPSFLMHSLLCLSSAFWMLIVRSEPVQYCKFGHEERPGKDVDFCLGALMYHNFSTNNHDWYLTMTVRRYEASALGWTAVGTGFNMKGSLMFIVYGDPLSGEDPIVSIRTVKGHAQPTLLTEADVASAPELDLRVVSSAWIPNDTLGQYSTSSSYSSYIARVSIICYSCWLWSATEMSATSQSQPWIWAWNSDQEFDVFTFDAYLNMHRHHAGAGGWGNFYLDQRRALNNDKFPPSLPPIRPNITTLGSSDTPKRFSDSVVQLAVGPGSFLHGLIMTTTFLLLFPIGVVGLRYGARKSFTYHWVIQLLASTLLFLGVGLGIVKSNKINTLHQWLGIGLASVIGLQGLFGWWHHRNFLRISQRTWVSHAHIWLGRLIMVAGWLNTVSGLLLRGYKISDTLLVLVVFMILCEAIGLSVWTTWMQRRKTSTAKSQEIKYIPKPQWANMSNDPFALSADSDVDDNEDNDDADEFLGSLCDKQIKDVPELQDSEPLISGGK